MALKDKDQKEEFAYIIKIILHLELGMKEPKGKNLIYLQRISFEQTGICRDDVSKLDANNIPGDEDGSFLLTPPTVSKDLKFSHIRKKSSAQVATNLLELGNLLFEIKKKKAK